MKYPMELVKYEDRNLITEPTVQQNSPNTENHKRMGNKYHHPNIQKWNIKKLFCAL